MFLGHRGDTVQISESRALKLLTPYICKQRFTYTLKFNIMLFL